VATIWLIPLVQQAIGWRWAFVILATGPILGVVAMLRLKFGRKVTVPASRAELRV
jgi:predicted MFS family arabinose efflux permease